MNKYIKEGRGSLKYLGRSIQANFRSFGAKRTLRAKALGRSIYAIFLFKK